MEFSLLWKDVTFASSVGRTPAACIALLTLYPNYPIGSSVCDCFRGVVFHWTRAFFSSVFEFSFYSRWVPDLHPNGLLL